MAGEAETITIAIPTYKRAHRLYGKDYFKSAVYVLPKSQRDDYRKVLPEKRMIVIPDEYDGNVAKKKNWIMKNMERPILMIDDDVSKIGFHESWRHYTNLRPNEIMEFIRIGFDLAEEWVCPMWGINLVKDPINYYQYRPISLTNMILGPFQGHLGHEMFFDERLILKEDYDMCLQLLWKYKKILRFDKFYYERPDVGKYRAGMREDEKTGGCMSYRTFEKEKANCDLIMRKWGKKVVRYNSSANRPRHLLNAGKINVPIRGV